MNSNTSESLASHCPVLRAIVEALVLSGLVAHTQQAHTNPEVKEQLRLKLDALHLHLLDCVMNGVDSGHESPLHFKMRMHFSHLAVHSNVYDLFSIFSNSTQNRAQFLLLLDPVRPCVHGKLSPFDIDRIFFGDNDQACYSARAQQEGVGDNLNQHHFATGAIFIKNQLLYHFHDDPLFQQRLPCAVRLLLTHAPVPPPGPRPRFLLGVAKDMHAAAVQLQSMTPAAVSALLVGEFDVKIGPQQPLAFAMLRMFGAAMSESTMSPFAKVPVFVAINDVRFARVRIL